MTLCPTPSKTPYSCKHVAKSAVRLHGSRKCLRVYLCRCGFWHLTKTRNNRRHVRKVAS